MFYDPIFYFYWFIKVYLVPNFKKKKKVKVYLPYLPVSYPVQRERKHIVLSKQLCQCQ